MDVTAEKVIRDCGFISSMCNHGINTDPCPRCTAPPAKALACLKRGEIRR